MTAIDRPTAYYYFFLTNQTITDVFRYVKTQTEEWDLELDCMWDELELLIDKTVEIAADHDWQKGVTESGIREFWTECQSLFENELADYFLRLN